MLLRGLQPPNTNSCLQLSPAAPQKLEAAVAPVAPSVLHVAVVPVGPASGWGLILHLSWVRSEWPAVKCSEVSPKKRILQRWRR